MRTARRTRHWFRTFDRIFYAIWCGLPLMAWLAYEANTDFSGLAAQLSPEQAKCLGLIPNPLTMSTTGKIVFWALFAFQLSIYVVLLAILHRMVHRYARGAIFVADTLASMKLLALTLIVWPFLETLVTNLATFLIYRLGDLPAWLPNYSIDIGPLAVGVFLLAQKFVIENAVELKTENDLTV